MWCGWYNDKGVLHEDWFICTLNKFLTQNKIVFVFLDLLNYFLVDIESNNPFNEDTHDTVNHSTALILFPDKNKYNVFYFNSHGSYQLDNYSYNKYIT